MFNFSNQLSLHCFNESIPNCRKQLSLSLRICGHTLLLQFMLGNDAVVMKVLEVG